MYARFLEKGVLAGIYSNSNNWQRIMGSKDACKDLAELFVPLWYAHYDNDPSFDDYEKAKYRFGGWEKPYYKQYKGDTKECGVGVDLNIY